MNGRELEKLYRRYLLADLPDFDYRGSLLFARPVVHLLRGFSFESSGFDANTFYLTVFVQPLYVPSDHIYFLFGKRLGGRQGDSWTMDRKDEGATMADVLGSIKDGGLYFLSRVQTPGELARKAPLVGGSSLSPNVAEALAYSRILAREYSEAHQELDRMEALLTEADTRYPWMEEMLQRGQHVRGLLERDPEEAIAQLEEWNEQTRANLKLPRDCPGGRARR